MLFTGRETGVNWGGVLAGTSRERATRATRTSRAPQSTEQKPSTCTPETPHNATSIATRQKLQTNTRRHQTANVERER